MALIYIGGATGTGTGATYSISLTALSGGLETTAKTGDLVIVVTGWGSNANGDPGMNTAGYTELADLYADDTADANVSINYKIMISTPDTAAVVNGSNNAAFGGSTVIHVWRGVDPSNPLDATTTTATGTNGARPDSPSITPVSAAAVVLSCGLSTDITGNGLVAFTAPSGYTNSVTALGAGIGGEDSTASIASKAWTSGAEDPAAWTGGVSTATASWGAGTLALRPSVTVFNNYQFVKAGDGMSTSEKIR